jgi:lipoprotein NlpD
MLSHQFVLLGVVRLFAAAVMLFMSTCAAAQPPTKRVALLIGNSSYAHERVLKNPVSDAVLLGRVFKEDLQFSDVRVEKNLSAQAMDRAIDEFVLRAQGADAVVLYYSGHGMKSPDRRNFLLPIDARTGHDDSPSLERQAVAAEGIRDKLKPLGSRITLVILDACRDGPGAGRTGSKGLARMGGARNLLVAYATEEDRVAADGTGNNSPYALALASALRKTNMPLLAQFDVVADEVRKVAPQQEPTREGNLRADAYLVTGMSVQLNQSMQIPSLNAEPVARAAPALSNQVGQRDYIVRPGDTVVRIALDAGLNYKDVVRWNNMKTMSDLYVGQVLRLTAPPTETVGAAPAENGSQVVVVGGGSELSFMWPTQRGVDETVTGFDEVRKGIDISGVEGSPVLASADGKVVYVGGGLRGYGNLIILKHNNVFLTAYAHNKTLLVSLDQQVKKGQKIAEMGQTDSDRVKLHFELRQAGKSVDPMPFFAAK